MISLTPAVFRPQWNFGNQQVFAPATLNELTKKMNEASNHPRLWTYGGNVRPMAFGFIMSIELQLGWARGCKSIDPNMTRSNRLLEIRKIIRSLLPKYEGHQDRLQLVIHDGEENSCAVICTNFSQKDLDKAKDENFIKEFQKVLGMEIQPEWYRLAPDYKRRIWNEAFNPDAERSTASTSREHPQLWIYGGNVQPMAFGLILPYELQLKWAGNCKSIDSKVSEEDTGNRFLEIRKIIRRKLPEGNQDLQWVIHNGTRQTCAVICTNFSQNDLDKANDENVIEAFQQVLGKGRQVGWYRLAPDDKRRIW